MKVEAKSFEEYFSKCGEFEADMRELDKLIREYASALKPVLKSGMGGGATIGYGLMPYKTKSMKEASEWPLLALAPQKNYMALYACAVVDGDYIAERYAPHLGKVNVGKSCIRFKNLRDIEMKGLKTMLLDLNSRYEAGENIYGA
ncbi:MAG: DUF1801 domain-containing protein [bacterium]|nr:DUF1801 domain-containing protein [bacterium]